MPLLIPSSPDLVGASLATRSAMPAWSFRLVTDFAELQAFAPEWQELLRQSADKEPMLAPAWLLTWWQIYGENSQRRLRVGLLYEGERLIGLAPLCQRRFWYRPGIPFTRLEFLGSDVDEQDGVCSIYLNLLARAGLEDRVVQAFVQEINCGSFGTWDEVVLGALNGETAVPERLLDAFRQVGYQGAQQITTHAPFLLLPASWDAYLKSLDKKHRKFITRALRDFKVWAGAEWKLQFARTREELVNGRQFLADLHNERWQQGDGIDGAFAHPRFMAFHQTYMPLLFQEGMLELFWLTVRGIPITANYQIVANRKVYYYQCGRSLNVPEPVRPGIVMVALALQWAIANGMREYDFLGGPAQYKAVFTRSARPIVQVRVARNRPREWLRNSAEAAIRYGRRLRNSLRG